VVLLSPLLQSLPERLHGLVYGVGIDLTLFGEQGCQVVLPHLRSGLAQLVAGKGIDLSTLVGLDLLPQAVPLGLGRSKLLTGVLVASLVPVRCSCSCFCSGVVATSPLHSLRHYYASLLIRHGESVKTVQARLGHASAVETLDTYSHLWPDSDDRTREAIDTVLGGAPSDLRQAEN